MIRFTKNGKYSCFSNFYTCRVVYEGLEYGSSEAACQSLKARDIGLRAQFTNFTPAAAKHLGRQIPLRCDWEEVKFDLMVEVCYAKFDQNPKLREVLLSTGDELLVEDTTSWHDNIWGDCQCPKCCSFEGQNLLGKALMKVRDLLRGTPAVSTLQVLGTTSVC